MAKKETVIVLCVDRDNDLGRKAKISGPIIGRNANLKAANKLILADPEESDANSLFAAIKKFDEIQGEFENIEIVTITGHGKHGFKSDKKLNEQLDALEAKYKIKGFILITDGAEDDQIIPIIQSRGRIISKQVVIVKQAQQVESVYYTLREALRDPYIARIVFGIPGIILLFFAITVYLKMEGLFLQGISMVIGAYLIVKGLGIEAWLHKQFERATRTFSIQRISFPLYLASFIILFVFIPMTLYFNISSAPPTPFNLIKAVQGTFSLFVLSSLLIVSGKAMDMIAMKRAYRLKRYFIYAVSTILFWFILDSGILVILEGALNFFLSSILVSFIVLLVSFRIAESMDLRNKITELLIGLPVYSKNGEWLGKVQKISRKTNRVFFKKEDKKEELKAASIKEIEIKKGRIVLAV